MTGQRPQRCARCRICELVMLLQVLGEYPAFITVTAFVVDSILSGGAVARSWSSYLAVLVPFPVNPLLNCLIHLSSAFSVTAQAPSAAVAGSWQAH